MHTVKTSSTLLPLEVAVKYNSMVEDTSSYATRFASIEAGRGSKNIRSVMPKILATVVRREGVPSELRLPSPNIVATATFRVSLYDFLSYSPPISWTIALILSASTAWLFPSTSTAWLFPSTSTAWRYLRGLTPIAIPSATLWHPVTRKHASHRVNQMHCPISSTLKLESAPEISRLHLTCAAGVPPPGSSRLLRALHDEQLNPSQ
ncbi:hypothetical protein IG631_08251 [Alternaria alternata]|nr:hypothetical protein IG631_08251 [Alternaria alternata]